MVSVLREGAAFSLCVALVGLLAGSAVATPISLEVHTLEYLLGPGGAADGPSVLTPMNRDGLLSSVRSQAFHNANSTEYLYLYQIIVAGDPETNMPVESFTLAPFTGVGPATHAGWLDGDLPPEFLVAPSQVPEPLGVYFNVPPGEPEMGFNYRIFPYDLPIDPGEHSVVMYVTSPLRPGMIQGNVIDGSNAYGPVVGPLPEPASLCLLAGGSLVLALARRRRA